MRRFTKAIITLAVLISVNSTGILAHPPTQSAMGSMTHGGVAVSASNCVTICNSAVIASRDETHLIDEAKDDEDNGFPPYGVTALQGAQVARLAHAFTARRVASLEPPPLAAPPHILFTVFRA